MIDSPPITPAITILRTFVFMFNSLPLLIKCFCNIAVETVFKAAHRAATALNVGAIHELPLLFSELCTNPSPYGLINMSKTQK
ncbi:hypothetical protein ES703_63899 [subsurface metagenome]